MRELKRNYRFWWTLLRALGLHGDAYNVIKSGGWIMVYYDVGKGKYVLESRTEREDMV